MSGQAERIGWAVRVTYPDGPRWTWPSECTLWDEKRAVMEAQAWCEDGYEADAMPLYAPGYVESLEAERDELRATVERLEKEIADAEDAHMDDLKYEIDRAT